jgi:CheY-like chemotaxis protein
VVSLTECASWKIPDGKRRESIAPVGLRRDGGHRNSLVDGQDGERVDAIHIGPTPPRVKATSAPQPNVPKAQILVVEDDEHIRWLVADVLERAGCDVLVAANGAEALDRVREACPQLIVLDLMMPVLDGWEFLKVTSREGLCAATPIVVMSAFLQTSAVRQVKMPPTVREMLPKPFDISHLVAIAERYIRH